MVFEHLQSALNTVQSQLFHLKLGLNADKTVGMLFSHKKKVPADLPSVKSTQGTPIEFVASYKYLGIFIDENLSFMSHIEHLLKQLT